MVKDEVKLRALQLLPKNALSRAFGAVSDVAFPAPLQGVINHTFAALVGVDPDESERPISSYRTLNEFFTRKLREGVHVLDEIVGEMMVSPVDGRLTYHGAIERDTMIQAKGRDYTVGDLLDNAAEAAHFTGGHYATFYLSPRDYHRIHSPVGGQVDKIGYVPGQLFPVNPFAVARVERLFAINERLISYLQSEQFGRVAVVKVGATCVGRIGLSFNEFQTNQRFRRRQDMRLPEPVAVRHGEELGVFNLGSTVVVLLQAPELDFVDNLVDGQMVRMGEPVARLR